MAYMKVIQVIARMNEGGTARWIETLITGLRKSGIEVILLAGFVEENEKEDPSFQSLGGVRVKHLGRSISILNDLKCIFALRRIIKKEKPDLINTHTAKAGALGRIAAVGLGIKVVHTYHGHLLNGYFSRSITKVFILIEKVLALFTDGFISVGSKVRDELVRSGISSHQKFKVIYPGIALHGLESTAEARRNFGIQQGEFVVGWLGRIVQIKRPDLLVEIAKELPAIKFLVGGTGELEQLIQDSNLPNLTYVGWQRPQVFWPACDSALLTSDNEGMPTALIEAAMTGLPLVARNVGSVSEIFEDKKGGILASSNMEIIDAIDKLRIDKLARLNMGTAARIFAISEFGVERFIEKHLAFYRSLI
jgi:glycosyltransferase involved in cell wall biosynthesis